MNLPGLVLSHLSKRMSNGANADGNIKCLPEGDSHSLSKDNNGRWKAPAWQQWAHLLSKCTVPSTHGKEQTCLRVTGVLPRGTVNIAAF